MKLPLILCDNGDVALFESVEDLERYVESPDIDSYRVFDANGDVLHLTTPASNKKSRSWGVQIDSVQVDADALRANAVKDLEGELRDFLSRVTGKVYEQSTLPELLAIL